MRKALEGDIVINSNYNIFVTVHRRLVAVFQLSVMGYPLAGHLAKAGHRITPLLRISSEQPQP